MAGALPARGAAPPAEAPQRGRRGAAGQQARRQPALVPGGSSAAAAHERWIHAKADASPKRVRLQGALPDAGVGIGLGEYVRVPGGLCDRRPLYESVDRCFRGKCHLRYVAAQGSWRRRPIHTQWCCIGRRHLPALPASETNRFRS